MSDLFVNELWRDQGKNNYWVVCKMDRGICECQCPCKDGKITPEHDHKTREEALDCLTEMLR